MVEEPDLIVEASPDPRDTDFLEHQINAFNFAVTGIVDWYPVAIFVREPSGQIVAGVSGGIWAGYLELRSLWVREDLRGRGYGRRLLEAAEREATAHGCDKVLLDTHDFQAPGFYRRFGYVVFGVFEGIGGQYRRYYMRKDL